MSIEFARRNAHIGRMHVLQELLPVSATVKKKNKYFFYFYQKYVIWQRPLKTGLIDFSQFSSNVETKAKVLAFKSHPQSFLGALEPSSSGGGLAKQRKPNPIL